MRGRNILVSFCEHRRTIYKDLGIFQNVILDCGAYTAAMSGKPVTLEKYISYVQKYGDCFKWYSALDVIGDWETTLDNFIAMRDEGLEPVAVFHGEEPWELLELYREICPLVALGSTPSWSKKKRMLWLEEIVSRYPHRYHLFRGTDSEILNRFSFESTDSSTWARAASYGDIPFPKGSRTRISELSAYERARIWVRYFELLS